MVKRTAASIQADITKGAFRPHTALSNMALAYYQSDTKSFAKNDISDLSGFAVL